MVSYLESLFKKTSEPKQYQIEVFDKIIKSYSDNQIGFYLNLPPGKGKTVILTGVLRHLQTISKKALIIAPRSAILQVYRLGKEWFFLDPKYFIRYNEIGKNNLVKLLEDSDNQFFLITPTIFRSYFEKPKHAKKRKKASPDLAILLNHQWDMIIIDEMCGLSTSQLSPFLREEIRQNTFVLAMTPTTMKSTIKEQQKTIFRVDLSENEIPCEFQELSFIKKSDEFGDETKGICSQIDHKLQLTACELAVYKMNFEKRNRRLLYQKWRRTSLLLNTFNVNQKSHELKKCLKMTKHGLCSAKQLFTEPQTTTINWVLDTVSSWKEKGQVFALCVRTPCLLVELRTILTCAGMNIGCFGSMIPDKIQEDFLNRLVDTQQIESDKLHGIVLQIRSAGKSHNFQMIEKVIILEMPVFPDERNQLVSRFHRDGCKDIEILVPYVPYTVSGILKNKMHSQPDTKLTYNELWEEAQSNLHHLEEHKDSSDFSELLNKLRGSTPVQDEEECSEEEDESSVSSRQKKRSKKKVAYDSEKDALVVSAPVQSNRSYQESENISYTSEQKAGENERNALDGGVSVSITSDRSQSVSDEISDSLQRVEHSLQGSGDMLRSRQSTPSSEGWLNFLDSPFWGSYEGDHTPMPVIR